MGIRIISDSTTEISQEEAQELGIDIVPLRSIFGQEVYLDGIDLSPEEFYEKLEEAEELPTTSQPAPHDFEQVFRRAQAAGDQIIVLTIASKLSGTYQSACIARDACGGGGAGGGDGSGDDNGSNASGIWIIDSETTTLALKMLVLRALELRDEGKTAEEIVRTIESEKSSIYLFALIDTLEYLHKGGRLSRGSAIAGTLMKVKPIISLTHGEIKAIGKSLGMKKGYRELFRLTEEAGGIDFEKPFAIGYTSNRERFEQFKQVGEAHWSGRTPEIASIGSVVGTHAGPGAVAVAFFALD